MQHHTYAPHNHTNQDHSSYPAPYRYTYKAAQHYLPNLIADRQTDNNGSLLQHYHSGLQPHGYYPNDPGQNSDT